MAKWIEVTAVSNAKKYLVNLETVDVISENEDGKTVISFANSDEYLTVANEYENVVNNARGLCNY